MKNIATFMLVSALMLGFFTSCDSGVQHRTFGVFMRMIRLEWEGCITPKEDSDLKWHWM